ncbi:class I adenylate-forming enzyme family protein [Lactobacillus panisapium]|uniref:class I adenylate-forming enzyme family protein n=1 Tax=Lactobacillus panisapium TaxID=2012495 RepID=UPI0022E0378E|nr:class I adenylate-forming enzyme family protein [Lactobacillus panisapium]
MNVNAKIATVKELWNWRLRQSRQKVFVIENDQQYSYGEMAKLVAAKIKLLKACRIGQGDLVALQFELDVENVATILACIELGAVINPLNPHLDITEVENLVERFQPCAIISQASVRGRDTISNFKHLKHYQVEVNGDLKIFTRIKHGISPFTNKAGASAPVIVINTSGTSGLSKGVVLSNQNVLAAEIGYNAAFGINKHDMTLLVSGLYHAIGFHHGLISTMMAGSTMVLMKHYQVDEVAKLLLRMPITCIDSLPTIMYDLLFHVANIGQLRMLICGGDKIKTSLLVQAKKRNIPLYNCYGLTEAVPFSYTPSNYFAEHQAMTTAVTPITGVKVRIVKKQHVVEQKDVQGIIEVCGPVVFQGYLNNPEKTREAFDHGWLITGDLGHYNSDGLFEIDGRNSDKIIRGGENISAALVEEKIKSCQNIKEVAVLGVPDDRLGQRIGAIIVLNHSQLALNKTKLLAELQEQQVDKKLWPEKILIVDSLPKTANGKVKKYLLRKLLEGKK